LTRNSARLAAASLAAALAARCATTHPSAPTPAPTSPAPSPTATPPARSAAPGSEWTEEGVASWYGGDDGFEGKPTASGEIYDSSRLTAAHRDLPLGTVVEVTNVDNGKRVRVRINDRGPFARGRIVDLSKEAARQLDLLGPGTGRVRLAVVSPGPTPTPVPSSIPWYVQVGSFADAEHARRQADRIRATGRDVVLEPYRGLTRVKVGPFATRALAEETLTALEASGFEGIAVPATP
jgi:rare lipoprotein A